MQACTCIENLYFLYSCINKQTGKGSVASCFIKQDYLLLLVCSLLDNCRLYTRYMCAIGIIQVIILGVILHTQMLSHLHKQQRRRAARDDECTIIALLEGDLKLS